MRTNYYNDPCKWKIQRKSEDCTNLVHLGTKSQNFFFYFLLWSLSLMMLTFCYQLNATFLFMHINQYFLVCFW